MPVVWEKPPPRNRSGGRRRIWEPILEPLTEKPGEWAVIKEFTSSKLANSCVQNLRRRIVRVPKGEWIFISRDTKVYAVYTTGLSEEIKAKILNEV